MANSSHCFLGGVQKCLFYTDSLADIQNRFYPFERYEIFLLVAINILFSVWIRN